MDAFVTSPGFEAVLAAEVGARGPAAGEPQWPCVVTTAGRPRVEDPVFARQIMPAVTAVRGASVEQLVKAVLATVDASVAVARPAADSGPLALHVFVPDPVPYRSLVGAAQVLGERLRSALGRTEAEISTASTVVQVALLGRGSALVSAGRPGRLRGGGMDIAPWPAGLATVREDRSAPSRAYRKIEEMFAWMGRAPAPDQSCVDLGGSPGGWAWTALKRQARVTAVDRAPLLPPAAGHPLLETVRGDAFAFQPPDPVDWLLCDVIRDPRRTLTLVETWMDRGLCRHIAATLKFKGKSDYGLLQGARERLFAKGWSFVRFKHLYHHHNEVALMAFR